MKRIVLLVAKKEIISVYEELRGILGSIEGASSWFDDEGFSQRANDVISRVGTLCPEIENINSYKIKLEYSASRGGIIHTVPTRANLSSLLGRIKGFYGLIESSMPTTGHTFIQNQSQSQSQSLVLEWQEKIIGELPKYAEGTKERGFLEKLKSALLTVKSATDILSSVLKIGEDLGLNPATIHKLLGL